MKNNIKEYDPQIYSRKLWLATENDINYILSTFDLFSAADTSKVNDNPSKTLNDMVDDVTIACVIPVERKSDGMLGALLILYNTEECGTSTIAHESVHVADYICDELGIYTGSLSDNEHYAYLVGWVAGKVSEYLIYTKNGK